MAVVDGRDQRRGIGFSEQDDLQVRMKIKHDYPACALFRGGRCTCDEASEPVDNAPMPKPNEPKRPPGRPEVPPEDRLQVVSLRMTEAQKAKLDRLGGSAWVREKINRAKEKK